MECGIDNVMVLFGTVISPKLVNYLVSLNVNRIIISLDVDENQAGQNGAQKTLDKLSKYFDDKNLIVAPITGANDFNELLTKCGKEAIINWYESIPQT
jgi:DNA primase